MASIVDTSVKNFNNTMAGLPAFTGAIGSLIALIDAVGVNGFDLKTASSLTIAGGVATLLFTGSHSAQADTVIALSGITGAYAALNGEQKVTAATDAGVVRFATDLPDGTASGAITFKMAPLGMAKVFSDTNRAAYRFLDPQGSGMFFYVDDTTTLNARVIGYEQMTDINTGVGPFPSALQYWTKSGVATGTVPWAVHGDSRILYFSNQPGIPVNGSSYVGGFTRFFGDLIAKRSGGDAYACGLCYTTNTTWSTAHDGTVGGVSQLQVAMPRNYTGLGSVTSHAPFPYVGTSTLFSGQDTTMGAFPSPIDGALQLSKKYIAQASSAPRGDLPGFYSVPQSNLIAYYRHLSREQGADSLAGRALQAVTTTNAAGSNLSANLGIAWFDVTGPWR
jgi:hypothetical protein